MKFRFRHLVSMLIVMASGASFSAAAPLVTRETKFYDIRGLSAAELRNQMNRLGITGKDGKRYDALTRSHVGWRFQHKTDSLGCSIASVTTTVRITYTYPRWIDRASAPDELRAQWERYMAALMEHEKGHEDLAVEAASKIESAIFTMAPRKDCGVLKREADALGRRILDESGKLEANYDAVTNHGVLRGARFP